MQLFKSEMWDVFAFKKGFARVSSAYGRFFPVLVWGDTATSDNHKGGGGVGGSEGGVQ